MDGALGRLNQFNRAVYRASIEGTGLQSVQPEGRELLKQPFVFGSIVGSVDPSGYTPMEGIIAQTS